VRAVPDVASGLVKHARAASRRNRGRLVGAVTVDDEHLVAVPGVESLDGVRRLREVRGLVSRWNDKRHERGALLVAVHSGVSPRTAE
jgi:hypothetical protein